MYEGLLVGPRAHFRPGRAIRPGQPDVVAGLRARPPAVGDVDAGECDVRAPATPSKLTRPVAGSASPTGVMVATTRGRSNRAPPSKERAMNITSPRVPISVPVQKT